MECHVFYGAVFVLCGLKRLVDHGVELVGNFFDVFSQGRLRGLGRIVGTGGDAFEEVAEDSFEQVAIDKTAARTLRKNPAIDGVNAKRGQFFCGVNRSNLLDDVFEKRAFAVCIRGVE